MRLAWISLLPVAMPSRVLAQDAPWMSPAVENAAFLTAFGLLLLLAAFLAWRAFERGEIVLENTPTLPKYMTRRPAYFMGALGYTVTAVLIYCIIVVFYRPFLPVVEFVYKPLYDLSKSLEDEGELTYPLVLLFAGVVYVVLLQLESRFNLLLLLRNVFYRGAAIPKKVRELLYSAKTSLVTPDSLRQKVLEDELVRFVDPVDFDKDWNTIDRKWADTSFLMHWLRMQHRSGHHATFFTDKGLKWIKHGDEKGVRERYLALADSIGGIKQGDTNQAVLEFTNTELERVRTDMCRLLVCFLVYKNNKEVDIWNEAADLGIQHGKTVLKYPLGRFVFFAVAFVVSAYLGSALSYVMFGLAVGAAEGGVLDRLDTSIVNDWALYSLLINGIPVFAVLAWRSFTFSFDPPEPGYHPATYAWSGVFGFLLGALVLSIAVKAMEESAQDTSLLSLLAGNAQSGILPAIYCAFITWRMDMVQPTAAGADATPSALARQAIWDRLKWGLPCALVSALVVLVPAFLIKEADLPPKYAELGPAMVRSMIIGTAAIIGLAVGLVARPLHQAKGKTAETAQGVAGHPSPVGG